MRASVLSRFLVHQPLPLPYVGALVLVAMTLLWGITFPAQKILLTSGLSALHITIVRFGIAVLVLGPLCLRGARLSAAEWRWGLLLGLCLFFAYWLQTEGLALTSSNRNAFITGLSVLAVPVLSVFLGYRPSLILWLACLLAALGVWLLFYEAAPWNRGDSLTLACMVIYAVYILLVEELARRYAQAPLRATALAAVQAGTLVLCAGTLFLWQYGGQGWLAFVAEMQQITVQNWGILLYLGLAASALAAVMQVWGQRHVGAVHSAIIYGLEPVWAALAAWALLNEYLHTAGLVGAILVVLASVFSQLSVNVKNRGQK